MRRVIMIGALAAALAACAAGSKSEKDTYTMPKGGMGSAPHTMGRPEGTPAPAPSPSGRYYMQKGHGMQGQGHWMER